jgi:hypothetical protein
MSIQFRSLSKSQRKKASLRRRLAAMNVDRFAKPSENLREELRAERRERKRVARQAKHVLRGLAVELKVG